MNKLFLVSGVLAFSLQTYAGSQCTDLFRHENAVVQLLNNSTVPVGEVNLGAKKIPVILANKESMEALKAVYRKSLGIAVTHQLGYNNDHGLLRLGDFFIDRDTPGARNRGEIHRTGITWASVSEYANYAYRKNSYNRVEVLFDLSPAEYNTAMIYQKMRRAAVVRPDFNFGGDNNPKNVNNRITEAGEICFSFSTGSNTSGQARGIENKIREMGIHDVGTLMNQPDVQSYILGVKKLILESDLSEGQLNPKITLKVVAPASIKNLNLGKNQEAELLNWVVGLKISHEYTELLRTLNISNSSSFSNVNSPRASAVLVYDGNVSKRDFLSPQYKSEGIFSTWLNTALNVIFGGN